jgi:hypothetical protein
MPTPLYTGEIPPVSIGYEAGWAPEPAWTMWGRETSFVPAKNNIKDIL